ncbi:MAG: ThuA domain-containing protein [Gemmatimonadetes bacterium]|nr:ThuA domain-containing protein [Gemmatimonadota bacterium]
MSDMWRSTFVVALISLACGGTVQGVPEKYSVLVFSRTAGFRHESIPAGIAAIKDIGIARSFSVEATEDPAAFTETNLARFTVVVFLCTSGDVLNDAQQAVFETYIHRGGAFVGVHSAADTEYDWAWYGRLVGTYFSTHAAVQQATVRAVDRGHPSTNAIPATIVRTDEWYDFQDNPKARVSVVMVVDEATYSGGGMGADHPISWYHTYEGGRAWYTAMGHTTESYAEAAFVEHLAGGLVWAAGAIR